MLAERLILVEQNKEQLQSTNTTTYTQNPLLHPHCFFSLTQECASKSKTPGSCNPARFGVHCRALSACTSQVSLEEN